MKDELIELQTELLSLLPNTFLGRLRRKYGKIYYEDQLGGTLDKLFFECFTELDIDCLLECGARDAYASVDAVSLGARAVAIEANPITYKYMTKPVEEFGVKVLNLGVGEQNTTLDFLIPLLDEMAGYAGFKRQPNVKYRKEKVKIKKIDDIAREEKLLDSNLALWIDVEGFTLEALRGGKNVLQSSECKLMKIEVEARPFFEDQVLHKEINDYIRLFNLVPIFTDDQGGGQFNVIYIKEQYVEKLQENISLAKVRLSKIKFPIYKLILRIIKVHLISPIFNLIPKRFKHIVLASLGVKRSKLRLDEMKIIEEIKNK